MAVDWEALRRDHPAVTRLDYTDRQLWELMWRYDPDRVALARALATSRRLVRLLFAPLIAFGKRGIR